MDHNYQSAYVDFIRTTLEPYSGMSVEHLADHFKLNSSAKNINAMIVSALLGFIGNVSKHAGVQVAQIFPRTIRVENNGHVRESMSFAAFDFIEISKQNWEESDLYRILVDKIFLFIIFKTRDDGTPYLSHVLPWKMPADDIEEVHRVWERTAERIREGIKFYPTSRGIRNNLPKATESYVAHVRPHAQSVFDTLPLPDGRKMPKQSFWLNSKYIESIIDENWQ